MYTYTMQIYTSHQFNVHCVHMQMYMWNTCVCTCTLIPLLDRSCTFICTPTTVHSHMTPHTHLATFVILIVYTCSHTKYPSTHTHTPCTNPDHAAHAGDDGHGHGDTDGGHGHGGGSGYAWHIHNLPVDQTLDPAIQCLSSWVGPHYDPLGASSVTNYSTICTPSTPER